MQETVSASLEILFLGELIVYFFLLCINCIVLLSIRYLMDLDVLGKVSTECLK